MLFESYLEIVQAQFLASFGEVDSRIVEGFWIAGFDAIAAAHAIGAGLSLELSAPIRDPFEAVCV